MFSGEWDYMLVNESDMLYKKTINDICIIFILL